MQTEYGKLLVNTGQKSQDISLHSGLNRITVDGANGHVVSNDPVARDVHLLITCTIRGCSIVNATDVDVCLDDTVLKPQASEVLRHNTVINVEGIPLRYQRVMPSRDAEPQPSPLVSPSPLPMKPARPRPKKLVHQQSSYMQYLPSLYHDQNLINDMLLACESIIEPIETEIDHIHRYFSPLLAPEPLLPWLGSWFGLLFNERWTMQQRRRLIAGAAALYAQRGTPDGLKRTIELYTGATVTIIEHGQAGGDELGPAVIRIVVTQADTTLDEQQLRQIIDSEKPAHVAYILDMTTNPTTINVAAQTSAE